MPSGPEVTMTRSSSATLTKVTADTGSHDFRALVKSLDDMVAAGFPSGFSLAVVDTGGVLFAGHGGMASRIGTPRPITETTSYDLASLTKVVCSVTLALVLEGHGVLSFEDPVRRFLPGFARPETTLHHLLTHTSGLVAHRPFFESLSGRAAIEDAVLKEAAGSTPTGDVLYSDLNFMLLGWVLESCLRARLENVFVTEVADRLGMNRTRFLPDSDEETAATELDGDQRLVPGLVWGEVHDGNCYALGGVAGHAGLFAPLDDLVGFTRHLLAPDGRVLTPAMLEAVSTPQAGRSPDIRGLGWRLAPESWGPWPDETVWHTGFTGTSLLVSRPLGIGVVLLSNAIHPHRRPEEQAEMRAVVHRLVRQALR